MLFVERKNLKEFTSFKIGSEALFVKVSSIKELIETVTVSKRNNKRLCILGEGTNTFFSDHLENLLVIKNEIKGISLEEKEDYVLVTAFSGENFDNLVDFCVSKDLWGVENLSGIPGSCGASPIQNIGAYGVEIKDVLFSLQALDLNNLNLVNIDNSGCVFNYRDSLFKKEKKYCIVSITLKLSKKEKRVLSYEPLFSYPNKELLTLKEIRKIIIDTRIKKLPDYKIYPNAGSFFKNVLVNDIVWNKLHNIYPSIPRILVDDKYKIPSAWLIENVAEMKGYKDGNFYTFEKQPLVIVNEGDGNALELINFSQKIIDKIYEKTGIILEREVNFIS